MRTIGVDVGGTFTDLVYCDLTTGRHAIHKVPTTPDDPSVAVVQGIAELCERHGIAAGEIAYVLHGTTTATNAVLENRGARTGMVTNEGFRDLVHIARHQRVDHYSIMQDLPWQSRPLVPRRYRKTVRGRLVPPRGEELVPLDEDAVRAAARELAAEDVEAVAVCFLFSYLDPRHEERARAILLEEMPGAFVTTSAAVSPQFREYERFTTASLAAFIGPKVRRYVAKLEAALAECPGERVTPDYIKSRIAEIEFNRWPGTMVTLCNITLDNGYSVRGESACVDPTNFDREIGETIAYEDAFKKLWPLFGFLLAEARHRRGAAKEAA